MSARQLSSFERLFRSPDLRAAVLTSEVTLSDSGLRSLVWRHFLGALPLPTSSWEQTAAEASAAYGALRNEHCEEPGEAADGLDLEISNPLSTHKASPWSTFFEATELREQIDKDLMRLHPDNDFFAQQAVREQMLRILIIWSKLHPSVSYRQGMHELLAPLLLFISRDAAEAAAAGPADAASAASGEDDVALRHLLREEDVEAAAYSSFCGLMRAVGPWFEPAPAPQPQPELGGGLMPSVGAAEPPMSALLRKCVHIQEVVLRRFDPPLQRRLAELEVEPQLYLLRWLRLLFGREFHLDDASVLWDAIFASGLDSGGETFVLVDYVAVSMLVYIRSDILARDYNAALRRLLKFPPLESIDALVARALQLRSLHAQAEPAAEVPRQPLGRATAPPLGRAAAPPGGSSDAPAKRAVAPATALPASQLRQAETALEQTASAAATLSMRMEAPLQLLTTRVLGFARAERGHAEAEGAGGGEREPSEATPKALIRALAELRAVQQVLLEANASRSPSPDCKR